MTLIEIVAAAMVIVLSVIIIAIASARIGGRRSRQMAQIQAQVNRHSAVAPATQAPQAGGAGGPGWQERMPAPLNVLRAGLVAVLLVLFFGVFAAKWEAPTPAALSAWAWDRWFWLIVTYLLVDVLTATFHQEQVTKFLRRIGLGAALGLLILVPLAAWLGIGSRVQSASTSASAIPLASEPESNWPVLPLPKGKGSEAKIAIPPDFRGVPQLSGKNYTWYVEYVDGIKCSRGQECPDGPIVAIYVVNEQDAPNGVRYAYAK